MLRIFFIFCFFLFVSSFGFSQAKVGDTAPAITVDEWLKGNAVTEFKSGTVYLIEFWGTWCHPCIDNIPHLSEIQKKYKDQGLIVIGVATHETKDRAFLLDWMKKNGDAMEYTVAYDPDLSMEKGWDTGGGDNFRLPVCFLVDGSGKVVFTGHPANKTLPSLIESTLSR